MRSFPIAALASFASTLALGSLALLGVSVGACSSSSGTPPGDTSDSGTPGTSSGATGATQKGVITGALDITAAFLLAGSFGVGPVRVLHGIAEARAEGERSEMQAEIDVLGVPSITDEAARSIQDIPTHDDCGRMWKFSQGQGGQKTLRRLVGGHATVVHG